MQNMMQRFTFVQVEQFRSSPCSQVCMAPTWADESGPSARYCSRHGWGTLNWNSFLYSMISRISSSNASPPGHKAHDLTLKPTILFTGRVCWSWKGSRGGFQGRATQGCHGRTGTASFEEKQDRRDSGRGVGVFVSGSCSNRQPGKKGWGKATRLRTPG